MQADRAAVMGRLVVWPGMGAEGGHRARKNGMGRRGGDGEDRARIKVAETRGFRPMPSALPNSAQ